MNTSRTNWIGWGAAIAFAVLFAYTNLLKVEALWGFNLATYLSPIWLYTGLGLVALSFLPGIAGALISAGGRLADFTDRTVSNRRLAGILGAVVFATLFWFGSTGLPLLGDGSLRCREITDGKLWQPTEALDFLTHALIFKLVTKPLHLEVTKAFRYTSILSGIVYLVGTYSLTRHLTRERWLIWTVAGLGLGVTVQFFGYVESYSITAALIPWLVLFGVKAYDGSSSPKWYLLFVVIAGLFHSVMFLLFAISAVLMLALRSENRLRWMADRQWLLWVAGAVVVVAMITGKLLNLPFASTYTVPPVPSATEKVAILSPTYLLNIVNWILLSALAVVPLAIRPRTVRMQGEQTSRSLFAYSLVVPAIVFILIFPPKLGGPIDWDLFSLPLAVIAFALMVIAEAEHSHKSPRWIVPILAVALVNTASFIAVNHSITASAERFSRIIPLSSSPNPWIHWSSLVVHAEHQPDLYNRRNEFLLKSWQAPPNNKRDSVTTLTKLMREAVQANDSVSTRAILQILNNIAGLPPEVLASETDAFVKFGTRDEQLGFAEMLEMQFPSSPVALGAAGVLYLNLGDPDRCGTLLALSYSLDSTNFRVALNYGVFLANKQNFPAATSVLKQALALDGSSFFAAYYLANAYLALGDIANAKAAMLRAEANAMRPEEQERIKQLRLKF